MGNAMTGMINLPHVKNPLKVKLTCGGLPQRPGPGAIDTGYKCSCGTPITIQPGSPVAIRAGSPLVALARYKNPELATVPSDEIAQGLTSKIKAMPRKPSKTRK